MAKTLSKSGIVTGADILAGHVTQSVDALTGIEAYDITISGSTTISGSLLLDGTTDTGQAFVLTYNTSSGQVHYTASNAIGSSGITPSQTGSFMVTGSVTDNTLTFTKGDGTTFDLTVDTGSSSTDPDLQSVMDSGSEASLLTGDVSISTDQNIFLQSTGLTNTILLDSLNNIELRSYGGNTLIRSLSGDVQLSSSLMGTPSVGDVVVAKDTSGGIKWTGSSALGTAGTLQEVTDQGNATTNDIIISGSLYQSGSVAYFQPDEFAVDALGDTVFSVGQSGTQDVKLGTPTTSTEVKGPLTASIISASGNLFASASDGTGISHVALYNTSSGQFFYTASNAIGGGGSTQNLQEVATQGATSTIPLTSSGFLLSSSFTQNTEIAAENNLILTGSGIAIKASSSISFIAGDNTDIFAFKDEELLLQSEKLKIIADDGTQITGSLSVGGAVGQGNITASSNISASGNIFANVTDSSDTSYKTVMIDPTTGQFFRTGSYGGGGGGSSTFPFTGDAEISGSLTVTASAGGDALIIEGTTNLNGDLEAYGTSSLRRANAGNHLYVGNSTKWESIEYGRDAGTVHKFNAETTINGNAIVNGNITASGEISSSGDIYGRDGRFSRGTTSAEVEIIGTTDKGVVGTADNFNLDLRRNNISKLVLEETQIQSKVPLIITGSLTLISASSGAGNISASGELFFSASLNDDTNFKTLMYDTSTGQVFHTGSYGGSGGSGGGGVGTLQEVTDSGSVTTNVITSSGLFINNGNDIDPDINGSGQLKISGNAYTGYIALNGSGMNIGHNSLSKNLTLQIDEETKLSILTNGNISSSGGQFITDYVGNTSTTRIEFGDNTPGNEATDIAMVTDSSGEIIMFPGKDVAQFLNTRIDLKNPTTISSSLTITGSTNISSSDVTINEGGYFRTFCDTTSYETLRVGQSGSTGGGELIISNNAGNNKIVLSTTEGYVNNDNDFGVGTSTPTSQLHVVSSTSSSLTVEGSGSTIMDVLGSQGQLFSVTDDLLDEVFVVSDISGDPLLKVSGSGFVSITLGPISASCDLTASAFKGDGSNISNLQRSILSPTVDITASNTNAGFYFRVPGTITCSIQLNTSVPCDIGSEFDFFQSGSTGNMLFVTESGVTLNSKQGFLKLDGQFSGATLKKVDTNEWDLVGDLNS